MPSFTVTQKVDGKPASVFKKLRTYCDKKLILRELGGLKPSVDWDEKKRSGQFNEAGVKGIIQVATGNSSKITVKVDLPFLLTPLKGVISESIQKHLAKIS